MVPIHLDAPGQARSVRPSPSAVKRCVRNGDGDITGHAAPRACGGMRRVRSGYEGAAAADAATYFQIRLNFPGDSADNIFRMNVPG